MKAVFDSDILIDFLQGSSKARAELNRYSRPLYSILSWMEVMCRADTDEEKEAAEWLFLSMESISLSPEVARKAVEERRKFRLKLPDAIILATADCEGCILVTRNTRDFDKYDPRVRFPYSL